MMQLMKDGDMSALGELVQTYQKPVYYYILGLIKDRDTAQDLVQDVFLKVWKYRKRYEESGRFNAWIYMIAHNLVRNHIKRYKKNVELLDEIPHYDLMQDRIEDDERLDAVKKALESLPEVFRVPVVKRDVEGMSYSEIAVSLGINEGTVKSRISRGREMIREKIKNEWGELYEV